MKIILLLFLSGQLLSQAQEAGDTECCVWSGWLDRDNPGGACDCEQTSLLVNENRPGACENPMILEARRVRDQVPAAEITDLVTRMDQNGFSCWNRDQTRGRFCDDFEVRMCCPVEEKCEWKRWLDRDNPSGVCDCETLSDAIKQYPSETCENPVKIEGRRKSDQMPISELRNTYTITTFDTTRGLACWNRDQEPGVQCPDLEVRFCCPA